MKIPVKPLVVASILGVVGTASVAGAGIAAAETASTSSDQKSSLVDKIASTFNLDKSKVQAVFDQDRSAHEAERAAERSEQLQKLVDAGTITAAQKTAIEAKIKVMDAERKADRESMKSLSEDERKAKMDEKRTELESWAKEQGLDLSKLKGVFGGHGGPGGRGGHGGPNA